MQTIDRVKDLDIISSKSNENRNKKIERYDMLCPKYIIDQLKMKASAMSIHKATDILITYALNEVIDKKGFVIKHTCHDYCFEKNNYDLIETILDKKGVLVDKGSHLMVKLTDDSRAKLNQLNVYEVKVNHYIITFKTISNLKKINHSRKKHKIITGLILSAFCDLNQSKKTICL